MFELKSGGGITKSWPLPLPPPAPHLPTYVDHPSHVDGDHRHEREHQQQGQSVGLGGIVDNPQVIPVSTTLMRNLILLLRHQALSHDFDASSAILSPMLSHPNRSPEIVFKMGSAILKHQIETKKEEEGERESHGHQHQQNRRQSRRESRREEEGVTKNDVVRFYRWISSLGRLKEEVIVTEMVLFLLQQVCSFFSISISISLSISPSPFSFPFPTYPTNPFFSLSRFSSH